MTLRLRTFGGLSIENATSIGSAAANRRPLALLALLAVKGRRGLSRDSVVALLWPDSDAEHGRNSLSQAISVLRRELGAQDVLLGTTELRVNPDVLACDVIEFEDRIAADDLEAATKLYTGPFLDGVYLRNTPEFERWVDQQRARLQHVQGDALERLATRATGRGDHAAAVRFWRGRAGLTPNESRAALELMKSLVAAGDPAGALAHHRLYHALLRDDFGLEPDTTLAELAAEIRGRTNRTASTPNAVSTGISASAAVGKTTGTQVPGDSSFRDQPAQLEDVAGTVRRPAKRRRAVLPIAAAVLAVGAAAAWGAKSGRFGSGPPPPPAHDSLRLRIVTAAVQSDSAHATLARQVRNEALAELARDPWLFVVTPEAWLAQAPLIGLDERVLAQPDTVRKYARKTRTHAIVDFSLSPAGAGFVITAEARGAASDSSLGVIAEAAAGPVDLPDAMTRLGRALRERLVTARATLAPTQWSLNTTDQPAQAITLYVEGRSEASRGNSIEATRRAEAAVRVDSTFAQAWRLRHSSLANAGLSVDDQLHAISAAFRFSNRVRAPYWRLEIVAAYYRAIGDPERALVFFDSIARIVPIPNTNAGLAYGALRRYDLATRGYRLYADSRPREPITAAHPNLVSSLLDEGKVAEAKRIVALMVRADSIHRQTLTARSWLFTTLRDWDSLSVIGKLQLGTARSATDSAPGLQWVGSAAIGRGQFAAFDTMARLTATLVEQHGSSGDYLAGQLLRAQLRATVAGDTVRARAIADSGLGVARWESLKPMDRPYLAMMLYLASVRDVQRGGDMAREWSRVTPAEFKRRDSLDVLVGRGELALASGDAREALRLFRIADVRGCEPCFYVRYARAFDALSERDSARVWFERYARAPFRSHTPGDAVELAHTYLRLGELHEQRRDAGAAITWYERFTALWAASDTPSLQAQVRDVRGRVDRLRKRAD